VTPKVQEQALYNITDFVKIRLWQSRSMFGFANYGSHARCRLANARAVL
jgi:hypothetical protein